MPTLLGTNLPQHIRQNAEGLRNAFLHNFLSSVPNYDCREAIRKGYEKRVKRAPDGLMLGEFAPFLVAELVLPGHELEFGSSIATAWHKLYVATILLDDHFDLRHQEGNETSRLFAVMYPMTEGVAGLAQYIPGEVLSRDYLSPIAALVHAESTRAGKFPPEEGVYRFASKDSYPLDELVVFGYKDHLLTLLAEVWLRAHEQIMSEETAAALLKLQAAVQLLDDLTDMLEDYRCHWTFPLAVLQRSIWNLNSKLSIREGEFDQQTMEKLAIYTGTTGKILSTTYLLMKEALEGLPGEPTATRRFVESLCSDLDDAATLARRHEQEARSTVPVREVGQVKDWDGLRKYDFPKKLTYPMGNT